ncbi:MAG: glycosyltransferase family 4 protein [Proteobacteria bacterium]|nr:glycosyltransferase family 4 protein [Pseudomonadota bacterium]
MRDVAFLIPGDLELPTGGYAYDRSVLRLLPSFGLRPIQVALPGSFPNPSAEDLEDCAAIVRSLPKDCLLLIDGLAYGAMPEALIRGFERPVVALCHHPLALENGISATRAEALYASERNALALARHVIVTSPMTARILSGDFDVPEGKITVAQPGATRKGRAAGSGSPRLEVLAVGSIVPRKGYHVLIEALTKLKAKNWRLSIVGAVRAPDCAAALDAQIAAAGLGEKVRLLGAVNEKALDSLYEHADLFVMSSLFEGYGMVLAEAMARGLPIVTTTGGAASETVPTGAGLKVPPGDADALAEALAEALADPALRRSLADAAFAAGENLKSWDDTASIIAQTLRDVDAAETA